MKYINEILALIFALMLIIASLCTLPMFAKVIFSMAAILYGFENIARIFKKLHEEKRPVKHKKPKK